MTARKAYELERFLKNPDPAIRAFLFYGPDTGSVRELATRTVRKFAGSLDDPFNVVRLTETQIADDPALLTDEAQALSMMGGQRVVWVNGAGDKFQSALAPLLADGQTEALIVADADNLNKSSKLRSLFEKAGNAIVVPCYQDNEKDLNSLINDVLQEAHLTISQDARYRLIELLGGDRALSRSELDKLVCYCAGKEQVTLDDVEAVCGDASALSLDDLIDAVFAGEAPAVALTFARLHESAIAPARLISAAISHVARLQDLALAVEDGRPPAAVVKAARPPIFFRRAPSITRQLSLWEMQDLERANRTLQAATLQTRQYPMLEAEISERAFLSLARSAQAQRVNRY